MSVKFTIDGRDYTYVGGIEGQLVSYETEYIPAGTVRYIGRFLFTIHSSDFPRTMTVFSRKKEKYRYTWSLIDAKYKSTEETSIALGKLRTYLESLI